MPVIARVNGHALGGGFEMVLGCDIVVACEEASFGLPEPRVGRMPLDGGMTLLQRQIPYHAGDGHAAHRPAHQGRARRSRIGLVNEVVPRAELDAAVARWVAQILACAPLSVQAIKQVVRAHRHRCRRRRRRRCACRRWSRRCSPRMPTKASRPSRRSASRSGRAADPASIVHASILKYFVEVARSGSIRKAAQNLFVASSAINRQIRKLEEELGTELFDRLPSGMRLNAAGERVLQHVRGTLHDYQITRTELDALKGERTGHVALASMDSLFIDFCPPRSKISPKLIPR